MSSELVPGKVLLRLCNEEDRASVSAAVEAGGHGTVRNHLRHLRTLPSFFVHDNPSIDEIGKLEGVCDVVRVRRHRTRSVNATYFYEEAAPMGKWWHVDRVNQDELPLDGDVSLAANGSGTNVFVLDTGLDTTHEELAGSSARNVASYVAGEEFEDWPEVGWNSAAQTTLVNDDAGHGTMTSATVAGKTLGIAPGVDLYHMRVLDGSGSGDNEWSLVAMDRIASLARHGLLTQPSVISASFGDKCDRGSVEFCTDQDPQALAVESLVEDYGIAVVVSAGNQEDDGCFYLPQAARKALSVGASDVGDRIAYFSNYGSCVDVVAPGVNIPLAVSRLRPDLAAQNTREGKYALADGTSFAAPAVAAALAIYTQLYSLKDTVQAQNLLLKMATEGVLKDLKANYCPENNRLLRIPMPLEQNSPRFLKVGDYTQAQSDKKCPKPKDRPGWPDDMYKKNKSSSWSFLEDGENTFVLLVGGNDEADTSSSFLMDLFGGAHSASSSPLSLLFLSSAAVSGFLLMAAAAARRRRFPGSGEG